MSKLQHIGASYFEAAPLKKRAGWIISYADLMTIILTFMILLLSISTIAQTKFDLMVESLTGKKVGNLQEVKTKIDEVVKIEAIGGEVTTNIDERGLTISFSNALLFESGEAKLTERGSKIFAPIGKHLVEDLELAYGLVVEGYTDDVPISNSKFNSNWELSTSRAIDVMERLHEEGLQRNRMSVQGFADTRPEGDIDLHDEAKISKLDTTQLGELRATNRRVVIRIDKLHEDVFKKVLGSQEKVPVGKDEGISPRDIPGFGTELKMNMGSAK